MKQLLLFGLLLCSFTAFSQDEKLQAKVNRYQTLINQSNGVERLAWLDSLTWAVDFNAEFKYDSIARITIDYAIEQDSISKAANFISDLIYYHNTYLGNPSESIIIYKHYEHLQDKLSLRDLARMSLNTGNAYYTFSEHNKAIAMYKKAKALAIEINHDKFIGLANMYIGDCLSLKGEFAEAAKILKESEPFFQKIKDTINWMGAKNSLSILYSQNGFFEEAQVIRAETLELAKKSNNVDFQQMLHFNASTDYRKMNLPQKRINSLKASYKANRKSVFFAQNEIMIFAAFVRAYAVIGDLKQAEKWLDSLEQDPMKLKEPRKKNSYQLALKHYYFAKGDFKKAATIGEINLLERLKSQDYEEILNSEKFLAKVYDTLGNKKKAYKHLKNFTVFNDSINSARKVKGMSYYQTLYETEKRDSRIKVQERDIAILAEKNKVKNQWIGFGSLGLLSIFGGILLFRSRNNYKRRQQLQEKFSQELMLAQEQERNRVAKDLHDGVGQQLTLIKKKAQNLNQEELAAMTSNTLDEIRSISRALYPPMLKKLGLTKSINQTLFDLDEETELFISSEVDSQIDKAFSENEALNFFRFIQEGVNNVIKHSKASTLEVTIIKEKNKIKALIRDNGIGFDNIDKLTQNSLGLKTMTERIKSLGGKLSIKSQTGKGTWLLAEINI